VYTSIGIDELARRVVRRFVVEYPTLAFHYGDFVATDYNSAYATKELAAADGFFYADTATITNDPIYGSLTVVSTTATNTEYTWTPPESTITADVLLVAGGGGGGGAIGGGGGAGGVVFDGGVSLSGNKTIIVGKGGSPNTNGVNTSFTNLETAIGGGYGGKYDTVAPGNGGSGGGGNNRSGGTGTTDQGYNGGTGASNSSGGGGGAGGIGGTGTLNSVAGNGGLGVDYSDIFGAKYGESGYFASGGGGGCSAGGQSKSISPLGGGGGGGHREDVYPQSGQKHTGGGGGGHGGNGLTFTLNGGDGGSGIVLIKRT
jgi:hypothetical protein